MQNYWGIRVATNDEGIGILARRYSGDFQRIAIGEANAVKYWLHLKKENHSYHVMISKSTNPRPDYNIVITVIGSEQKGVEEIIEGLEQKMKIKTREAPASLQQTAKEMSKIFA